MTADDIRDRCADRLLAKDAESWGYGMFEGDRDAALAVADTVLAVRDPELERVSGYAKRMEEMVIEKDREATQWAERLHETEATIRRIRALHKPFTLPGYTGQFCDECADGHGSASRWPCSTLAALDPPVEVIELTHEEWETARDNDLTKLGCTLAKLEEMARTGDYATPRHRALWLGIKPVPREEA